MVEYGAAMEAFEKDRKPERSLELFDEMVCIFFMHVYRCSPSIYFAEVAVVVAVIVLFVVVGFPNTLSTFYPRTPKNVYHYLRAQRNRCLWVQRTKALECDY